MIERASGDIVSAGEAKQQYDLLCGPPDKAELWTKGNWSVEDDGLAVDMR
jgi:hypothetical protein